MTTHRKYMGHFIYQSTCVHLRWVSWCNGMVYADTLAGIKALIRERTR